MTNALKNLHCIILNSSRYIKFIDRKIEPYATFASRQRHFAFVILKNPLRRFLLSTFSAAKIILLSVAVATVISAILFTPVRHRLFVKMADSTFFCFNCQKLLFRFIFENNNRCGAPISKII